MTSFYTADLHLGHANIIRYSNRPFSDVSAMDRGLIDRWNAVVGADDDVLVLGDVAMGTIAHSLPLVRRLHGTITLVPGNHDRCWAGNGRKAASWEQVYLDAGFDRIEQMPASLTVAGRTVLLSHFPYRGSGDHTSDERFSDHRLVDRGEWLIHGHVHDMWRQRDRQINVGIDAWGGRPVSRSELESLIYEGPRELAPLPWAA